MLFQTPNTDQLFCCFSFLMFFLSFQKIRSPKLEIVSTSSRSSLSESSSDPESNKIAISNVPDKFFNAYLSSGLPEKEWVTKKDLLEDIEPLEKIYEIKGVKDVPREFLQQAYHAMCHSFLSFGYPDEKTNEATISDSIRALLQSLVTHFLLDRDLNHKLLRIKAEIEWQWEFNSRTVTGRTNFQVGPSSPYSPQPAFLIVECKSRKFDPIFGLSQCGMFAKRIWETEKREVVSIDFFGSYSRPKY